MEMNFFNLFNNSIRRGSGANLNLFRHAAMIVVLLLTFGVGNAWGHDTHYNRANVALATGSTGIGTVYLIESNQHKTQSTGWNCEGSSSGTHSKNFECHCEGWADGYYFAGWNTSAATAGSYTNTNATATLSFGDQSSTSSPGDKFYYAWILGVKPTAASGDMSFDVDNLSTTYTKTINFTQTGGDAKADFYDATISAENGTWEVVSTTYNSSTQKVDVVVTYTSGRSKWTNASGTRSDKATLTLKSKGNEQYSVEVSANLPLVGISAGTGGSVTMDNAVGTKTGSATFPVTGVDDKSDFNEPTINKTSGEGTWAITSYSYSANTVTINYSHTGGGTYGTRASAATITLSAKTGGASQSVNVTASYPSLVITSAEDSKAYTPSLLTDGPGVATFHVSHADGLSDFVVPTEITPIDEGGTWTIGETTYTQSSGDPSQGTVQVNYTYNSGGYVGTRTAELTLSASSGATLTLTLSGVTEPEATNDASVTPAGGSPTEYATFAQALAAANGLTGSTLTLLRNVDLGTITTTNNITKKMTIDLNGKELRAAVNATSVGVLTITKAVAVTIKDSKTGGKIINEIARNSEIRTIFVNKAGATLTLESGTIAVNNLGQYASAANADLGVTAAYKSCTSRAIHQIAGTTVNINGGRVEAYGTRSVYGIVQASSAATNAAGTSVLNITNGEIYAEAPCYAYGICAYGKVNFSDGTITSHINTHMVDARYAADAKQNTYNGYGYGIYMGASASATATSCYFGTLEMTGGTINVTNDRTLNGNYPNYGLYLHAATKDVSSATAVAADGKSHGQIASAKASVEGGEISVVSGTQYSYGVYAMGGYNSYDNTNHTVQLKNCKITSKAYVYAYGVGAFATINTTNGAGYAGDVELTNCDVYAESLNTSTASAVWVYSTSATIYKDGTTANAAAWGGEFAVAGKAVINSGKYESLTKTTTAYAAGTSTRAKTTYDAETTVQTNRKPGGHAEAYPTLIIHGGTFKATTTTTSAFAISNGGYTTIDGGTFEAYATGRYAYGFYTLAGKLTASGVSVTANATQDAYGAYANVSIPAGNMAQTGFAYAGELELNNCDITATTRSTTEARGVYVNATNKMHTWAGLKADSTSNKWAKTTYDAYKSVFPCTIAGHDSVGIAIAAKATINGCDIKATAATTTAYGIYSTATSVPASADSVASPVVNIKNTKFTVKTNGTTTAYGMYAGGPTTIDGCDFTVLPKTTTAYGVYAYDKKTTITNTKFDVKGTTTAHGIYANAAIGSTTGWDYHGEFELGEGNDMTVAATAGNTSHVLTLIATKKNVASGRFMGDYANAASAHISGGSYKATATGTTSYVLNLSAQQVQGSAVSQPSCTIEGGKFWALASGGTTGICTTNGVAGSILFKGGVYNVNTTLSKHIPEGYEEFPLSNDRPEYTEGYRYAIEPVGNHGINVCQIGSTKYKSLEEALQVVTSGQTILMLANYTLPAGDWILPSGAKLLVPRSNTQTALETNFDNIVKYNEYTTPSPYITLTFASGARLDARGDIQVASLVSSKGQMNGYNGTPYGPHGKIVLQENSQITLESGAKLYAWGYVTGAGTIDAKDGSKVYECMQIRDWRGGTNTRNIYSQVFPFNQYYIQNVESKIRFRPGAEEYGYGAVNASSSAYTVNTKLIGTSNALFLMNSADVSADTWVQKSYDFERDYQVYEVNSAAQLSNLVVSGLPLIGSINSSNYTLPLVNNMHIHLLSGKLEVIQDVLLQPGVIIEIDKEAKCVMKSGKKMYVQDSEDTQGYDNSLSFNTIPYSPQGSVAGKRTLQDAFINMHGAFEFNGYLYTSEHGANIFSTNEDAGTILFKNSSPSNATLKICNTGGTIVSKTFTTPQLKNGEGETPEFTSTSGSVANDEYAYYLSQWRKWVASDCFTIDKTDNSNWKYYIKPAEYVQVTSNQPDANKLHHDAATGTRNFVWDENCYWWEVVTTPTAEGYYRSINADHNGDYNYYYYDSAVACWKIKKITVTWNIEGSTTNYSVGYGTKPEWLGANPTKTSTSSNYVWRWDGWTMGSDPTVLANNDLPYVTENTTFTAHFYEKYYEYNITFKNDDGTVLDSRNWNKGTTPSYEGTPTKNPTAAETYEFNGTWTPAIATVSGSATYMANYTSHPRAYTVTFLNYDMSVLGTAEVVYNGTPSNATYLAAVAPVITDPYKPDNSAYSFEFAGWRLQGASENGFAQVKGDQTYVAQFAETTKKYRISFVDEDGETVLHWTQLEYGATPSYDGPATSGFNRQDAEWNYTFTGWAPAEFAVVEGAQTYTAVYNKTKRKYDITWKDGDGKTLKTDQVAYGETPAYSGETPTKAPTNTQNFTFNGTWSPAIVAVVGEATYTAQFDATERKYKVTWDANGGACATEYTDFSYNAAIGTLPVATKEGHTFNGWFTSATGGTQITPATKVTANVTYHAQFTVNPYTITFDSNGGSSVASITQNYGTAVTAPADPTREGYTFNGWSPAVPSTMPVNGMTCVAQWTVNPYTITFDSNGGSSVASITQNYGTAVTAPADPTREGYKFEGWYKEEECTNAWDFDSDVVEGNTTLYAKWIPVHTLTITATPAGYGTVSPASVANVPEGSTVTDNGDNTFTVNGITVEATPKAADEQYTYTFKQWNNMPDAVTGDVTIEAEFARTTNKYTITWIGSKGETLLSEQLTYGQTPNYTGETPGKDMTTGVVYTFKGWTPEPTTVTDNATYTATFLEAPRPYPVLWVDWNGHTLASTQRSYGDPAPPASQNTSIPTRASENGKVYTFSGWSDPVSVVEGGDVTYTALYRVDLLANEPSLPVEINEDTEVVTTTVRVSGALHIANNAKLTTTDLILEAGESQSGEITGNVVANNVYFDLAIKADRRHWNVFGVPFEIGDLDNTKLQYKNSGETTWHNMILGTHYDITYHDEATRASRGPVYDCWKYIEDLPAGNRTLQPGVAYSISLLFHVDTLRFTKASNSPIHYSENVDLVNTKPGDATNGGWNGIANPATFHTLLATGVDMIQIHDGGEIGHDTYDAYPIASYKFVVGKAGYVQVTDEHSILDVDEAGDQDPIPSPVHAAPRRSNGITASELYTVELSSENMRTDRVYVKADEDKADEYTIGSDVMKLSTSQARPQIWVEQYNVKLCKSTMAPVNGQTVYPLGLYAPVAGEYTITNNQSAEVEEENTLYLTYDGLPIWNLTDAPYSIQLEKGTSMHYGLLLVRNYAPSVTTGTEEIQTGLQAAQKVLWNNQVYILRGGEVYTVTGKKVQ